MTLKGVVNQNETLFIVTLPKLWEQKEKFSLHSWQKTALVIHKIKYFHEIFILHFSTVYVYMYYLVTSKVSHFDEM